MQESRLNHSPKYCTNMGIQQLLRQDEALYTVWEYVVIKIDGKVCGLCKIVLRELCLNTRQALKSFFLESEKMRALDLANTVDGETMGDKTMASTDSAQQPALVPIAKIEYLDEYRSKIASKNPGGRNSDKRNSASSGDKRRSNVLVLEERFPFYASIEINDLHWVRAQFSARTRDQLIATVKKILCQEFGRMRVERDAFQFAIRHGNINELMKKLVQVQFYTNQILLPEYNLLGERNELNGIYITWGVGRNLSQATEDRVRKRNQKFYRR